MSKIWRSKRREKNNVEKNKRKVDMRHINNGEEKQNNDWRKWKEEREENKVNNNSNG
jgi:hypothetical protein